MHCGLWTLFLFKYFLRNQMKLQKNTLLALKDLALISLGLNATSRLNSGKLSWFHSPKCLGISWICIFKRPTHSGCAYVATAQKQDSDPESSGWYSYTQCQMLEKHSLWRCIRRPCLVMWFSVFGFQSQLPGFKSQLGRLLRGWS